MVQLFIGQSSSNHFDGMALALYGVQRHGGWPRLASYSYWASVWMVLVG